MDAAASWLKPQSVVESEVEFLTKYYANAGRGICKRAGKVDDMIAVSRKAVADFIGADPENIVFTFGATDGLNRIVNIITSQSNYKKTATFAVSDLDHHSARLPWENLLRNKKIGAEIVYDLDENLNIKIDSIPKTDFLVITAMSNVFGVAQDVGAVVKTARQRNPNVVTIVDASQYVVHEKIDVKKWDCDFLVFSGHKIGADTGIGVLYIRDVEKYSPDKFGGGMINKIVDDSTWVLNQAPDKFEAGTLPLTQIIGLPHAIDYVSKWSGGHNLIKYMHDELSKIPQIKILTKSDACMLTFVVDNMHPLDMGTLLGAHGICVRVGNMCASWVHKKLNLPGSVRVSVGPWNTMEDAEYVVKIISNVVK